MAKAGKDKGQKKKKPRPITVGKAKDSAWRAFAIYIKLRDALKTTGTLTKCKCITCGKFFSVNEIQAGHGIGGRTKNILFDEDITNAQCARCNIFMKGDYDTYHIILIQRHGIEWFTEKVRISKLPAEKPWRVIDLQEIEQKYLAKIRELKGEK